MGPCKWPREAKKVFFGFDKWITTKCQATSAEYGIGSPCWTWKVHIFKNHITDLKKKKLK